MPILAVTDDLNGIDEALKPLYVEKDGKFHLDIDENSLRSHHGVLPLANAYERTKGSAEKAKADADSLKAQIAELQKAAPDTAATQAKLSSLQEQLDAAKAAENDWRGKYVGKARDEALTQALQTAGVTNPAFLKAAQAMLSGMVKLGEDGTAYVETPMGPKTVEVFAKGWAASEGKDFVTPAAGGGAKGNDGTSKGQGAGNIGGSRDERVAALKQRFPGLTSG